MKEINCKHCGGPNAVGSRFCGHCGASLQPSSEQICPSCQTVNSIDLLYCDNCGTRLNPDAGEEDESESAANAGGTPQPFSLPERSPGQTGPLDIEQELPDWLRTGEVDDDQEPSTSLDLDAPEESGITHRPQDDLPEWLVEEEGIGAIFESDKSTDELFERDSTQADEGKDQEPLPSWLEGLSPEGTGPLPTLPLADLDEAKIGAEETDIPDWMAEVEQDDDAMSPSQDEAVVEGVDAVDAERPYDNASEDEFDVSDELVMDDSPWTGADLAFPDWLLSERGESPEEKTRTESDEDDFPDWLSRSDEEEVPPDQMPDWLRDDVSASPAPPRSQDPYVSRPREVEEGVPEWLGSSRPPEASPDWDADRAEPDMADTTYEMTGIPTGEEQEDEKKAEEAPHTHSARGEDEPSETYASEWEASFLADEVTAEPSESMSGDEDADATFLRWLNSLEDEQPETAETNEAEAGEAAGDLSLETVTASAAESETAHEQALPGWLDELDEVDDEESDTSSEDIVAADIPSWLRDLAPPGTGPLPQPNAEEPAPATPLSEGSDDLLTDIDTSADLPDWLAVSADPQTLSDSESTEGAHGAGSDPAEGEEAPEEGIPDWLASIVADEGETAESTDETIESDETLIEADQLDSEHDWLSPSLSLAEERLDDGGAEVEVGPAADVEDETSTGDDAGYESLPEWFIAAAAAESIVTDERDSELDDELEPTGPDEIDDDFSGLPAWMRDIAADEADSLTLLDIGTESDSPPEEETPGIEHVPGHAPEQDRAEVTAYESPGEPAPEAEDELWEALDLMEAELGMPAAADEASSAVEPAAIEDMPPWLQEVEKEMEDEAESDGVPANATIAESDSEMPEWLVAGLGGQALVELSEGDLLELQEEASLEDLLAELAPPDQGKAADELSRAQIPAWIENLRPGIADEDIDFADDTAPESGPLTGLPGVVAVAPAIAAIEAAGSARVATERNTITKEQQQQVILLRQLAQAGTVVVPGEATRAPSSRVSASLLLSAVALFLLTAIFAGRLMPDLLSVAPPPVADVQVAETALAESAEQPVIVAFDYSPAVADALDAQADAFLRALAANNSTVLYLSQSPAGLALAEMAMARAEPTQAVNLGFIPAESIGLRRLAACLDADNPCLSPFGEPLATETSAALGDAALIVILTGDTTTLVDWIEQVGAAHDVPILAGVTEAVAPVAAPYAATGQVQAVLAGAGAAQALGGSDSSPLTSLALAQWTAVALILVGGVYFAIVGQPRGDRR